MMPKTRSKGKTGNMRKKNATAWILAAVLVLGAIAGCGTKTETVFLKPDCRLPARVTESDLPVVDAAAVYDALEAYHGKAEGRRIAEALRARERMLVDVILEQRAVLEQICKTKTGE